MIRSMIHHANEGKLRRVLSRGARDRRDERFAAAAEREPDVARRALDGEPLITKLSEPVDIAGLDAPLDPRERQRARRLLAERRDGFAAPLRSRMAP